MVFNEASPFAIDGRWFASNGSALTVSSRIATVLASEGIVV